MSWIRREGSDSAHQGRHRADDGRQSYGRRSQRQGPSEGQHVDHDRQPTGRPGRIDRTPDQHLDSDRGAGDNNPNER